MKQYRRLPFSVKYALRFLKAYHKKILSVGVSTVGDSETFFLNLMPDRTIVATTYEGSNKTKVQKNIGLVVRKFEEAGVHQRATVIDHDVSKPMDLRHLSHYSKNHFLSQQPRSWSKRYLVSIDQQSPCF